MHDTRTKAVTEVITFRGVVQGVGFRPTVYRIAQRMGMKGRVRNMGGAVQLVCTDIPEKIDRFVREINLHKPPMARISGVSRERINTAVFHDFSIATSSAEEDEISVIPADIAVCDDCLCEFYDTKNERYLHPFISCTNCGPRYSIIERLPYDRDTTTMRDFPMCGFCGGEYTGPSSRRYHAQTISCHECGPRPILRTGGGCFSPDESVQKAVRILKDGGVLALKGVGGYYLACSPFDKNAVRRLREIKRREQKPFAVMFRDAAQIKEFCEVNETEEEALLSPERPILLLEQRKCAGGCDPDDGSCCMFVPEVNNTSRFTGAFLPSFGLQYLLLDGAGPLIMTSANVSELPVITEDNGMEIMADSLDGSISIAGVLYNERRIAAGLDDSVARVIDSSVQMIRRSKGYVPSPVYIQSAGSLTKETMIFAAGGHLKSVFALSKGAYSYLSRHIGDLESIESENLYRETFSRMKEFFGIEPGLTVCDMHPRYFSTIFSETLGLPLIYAQHHHAHIASVMAEHGLAGPVIGVAFDGTGYGTDGAIWGGEILICEGSGFRRYSHLKYVDMIEGDSSVKEGWISALSYLRAIENGLLRCARNDGVGSGNDGVGGGNDGMGGGNDGFEINLSEITAYCKEHGTLAMGREDSLSVAEAAIDKGINTIRTSSMGRLFDAVSAMLGVHYENRYEGECAVMLENAAQRALDKEMPTEQERRALDFHFNVAKMILKQCRKAKADFGIQKVCLSGGTFQNKILLEETLRLLRKEGFPVYYNIHVPPNDGGLALGQNYIGMASAAKNRARLVAAD